MNNDIFNGSGIRMPSKETQLSSNGRLSELNRNSAEGIQEAAFFTQFSLHFMDHDI